MKATFSRTLSLFILLGLLHFSHSSSEISMDLINKGTYITLAPGYSLTITVDFTFYKSITQTYYTDWKLVFVSLTNVPTATTTAQCTKQADGEVITLPSSYFPTDATTAATYNIF